jgi:hypothetical protein
MGIMIAHRMWRYPYWKAFLHVQATKFRLEATELEMKGDKEW